FSDGYRLGAVQMSVTVAIADDGRLLTAEQWAQAAFEGSNHPGEAPAGPARAIQLALAEQVRVPLRALAIGDTVTVHGQMWACDSGAGWRQVDATSLPDPSDYVSAVRGAIENGQTSVDRYLTTICPDCRQVGVPGDGDHRMIGPYVIV